MDFTIMDPLRGSGRKTSPFGPRTHPTTGEKGKMHNGLDLAAPEGTPVYAAADGVVSVSSNGSVTGLYVTVKHNATSGGEQYGTDYLHLSRVDVARGQQVKEGDQIGLVGSTGRSTGPHLHFNVQRYSPSREWRDPEDYITRSEPRLVSILLVGGTVTVCCIALLLAVYKKKNL